MKALSALEEVLLDYADLEAARKDALLTLKKIVEDCSCPEDQRLFVLQLLEEQIAYCEDLETGLQSLRDLRDAEQRFGHLMN